MDNQISYEQRALLSLRLPWTSISVTSIHKYDIFGPI